ncbi:protein translocase subunit [Nowakowskiella sp. JEL0407]|nr:protein translocase subunit [Nowakowskiella sp. JEL0407]
MESDAMQSAKKAMESGTKAAKRVGEAVQAVVDNPAVKKTVEVVGDGIGKVGEVVGKVAEPILETEAAKKIAEGVRQIDESVSDLKANSRYVEYRTKADRQRLKEKRLAQLGHPQNRAVSANLEAGGSVVIHKQSRWAETWKEFTENSPIAKSMFSIKRGIEETDSPLMERIREIFASPVFQETEQSRVVRAFRSVDPSFNLEDFTTEIAEFVVPDIMEAYLSGDAVTLEEWCSERAYAQLTRGFEVQTQHGLISDCKLLDIRQLQLAKAMVIEDGTMGTDVPVLTYRFTTQEVLLFRNVKGEVALGKEDNIVSSGWVIVFTKDQCIDPTIPVNPNTNGWRVLEAAKMDSW